MVSTEVLYTAGSVTMSARKSSGGLRSQSRTSPAISATSAAKPFSPVLRGASFPSFLIQVSQAQLLPPPASCFLAERVVSPLHADNSSVFRDIKSLGYRKVVEEGTGGYRVVEVSSQSPHSSQTCTLPWALVTCKRLG